jgi:hypothetical protein
MCLKMQTPDGDEVLVCGGHARTRYCKCGRAADLLCDWKVAGKKSGTCDEPVCKRCAVEVAPNKHLCKAHQAAWESWKHRHGPEEVERVISPQKALETQQSLF